MTLPFRTRADGRYESWPISQLFEDPRYADQYRDPETKEIIGHEGIDWACCTGTPIHAMAAGVVDRVIVGEPSGLRRDMSEKGNGRYAYGNYVAVRTGGSAADGYDLSYAHLSVVLVRTGDRIAQGDPIGVSGNTGNSEGPHLHVRYRPNRGSVRKDRAADFKDFLEDHPYLHPESSDWPVFLPDTEANEESNAKQANRMNKYVTHGTCAAVRAKAGAKEVKVYGASSALARVYKRPLKPGEPYPLLGQNRTSWILNPRRTPEEERAYTLDLDWWQIDAPEYPVAWVIRSDVELVDWNDGGKVRAPSGTWPDMAATWPAVHDVRAWHLRQNGGQTGGKVNVYNSRTAAEGAANIVGALDDGRWRKILDRQYAKDKTYICEVRHGQEAGATGWVRGDEVTTQAFLAAGEEAFDDAAAPTHPYLQVKADNTLPLRVRPEPNTTLGALAAQSRTSYEIVGKYETADQNATVTWWQIRFVDAQGAEVLGWVHGNFVEAYNTEDVPVTWPPGWVQAVRSSVPSEAIFMPIATWPPEPTARPYLQAADLHAPNPAAPRPAAPATRSATRAAGPSAPRSSRRREPGVPFPPPTPPSSRAPPPASVSVSTHGTAPASRPASTSPARSPWIRAYAPVPYAPSPCPPARAGSAPSRPASWFRMSNACSSSAAIKAVS